LVGKPDGLDVRRRDGRIRSDATASQRWGGGRAERVCSGGLWPPKLRHSSPSRRCSLGPSGAHTAPLQSGAAAQRELGPPM